MAINQYNQPHRPRKNQESPEAKIVFGILKGLLLLVSLPFKKGQKSGSKKTANSRVDTQEVARRWADIQTSVGLGGTTHFGSAIVSADKLLDYVLRQKGYAGETMGDRLKSAQDDVSPELYNKAWQVHKLRNQLVHEVDSEILSFQAKEAILDYERILRAMGALR